MTILHIVREISVTIRLAGRERACYFAINNELSYLWSKYRIQAHFGPPRLDVWKAFVERSI